MPPLSRENYLTPHNVMMDSGKSQGLMPKSSELLPGDWLNPWFPLFAA